MNKTLIYFVIPAYNEGAAIGNVIKKLQDEGFSQLIIIDDGSSDQTFSVVRQYEKPGLVLLRHVINRGQGAALRTGIEYARSQEKCKYIVTFDSDGQHRISDLPKFIKRLDKGDVDIVLGSRFLRKSSRKLVPLKKKIVLQLGILVTAFLSTMKLTDTHNGYRVMNKRAASLIEITMDGFEHASEIIDEIGRKKIPYAEVPVFIDYTDYSKQKGQKISNSLKIVLKMIFKK